MEIECVSLNSSLESNKEEKKIECFSLLAALPLPAPTAPLQCASEEPRWMPCYEAEKGRRTTISKMLVSMRRGSGVCMRGLCGCGDPRAVNVFWGGRARESARHRKGDGSEESSYLRLIDLCTTQLGAGE